VLEMALLGQLERGAWDLVFPDAEERKPSEFGALLGVPGFVRMTLAL
jgi:hypothetical protein